MVKYLIMTAFFMVSCTSVVHNKINLLDTKKVLKQSIPLKLNGFYYSEYQSFKENNDLKAISVLLLYKNGFVVSDGIYFGDSKNYCVENNNNDNSINGSINVYKSRLKLLSSIKFSSCKIDENDFDGKGLFFIENDSIILQYYKAEPRDRKNDSFNDYFLYELKGIILNNETLKFSSLKEYRTNSTSTINLIYRFVDDNNVPVIKNKFLDMWSASSIRR